MAQQAFLAGAQGSSLTINPPAGEFLVVNITGGTVTSDAAGTTTVTFPQTISAATTYYSQNTSKLTVSCKVQGIEIADSNGGTYGWAAHDGASVTIAPSHTTTQAVGLFKDSGTAVLVAGTKAVPDTNITANSKILLTTATPGGTQGACFISALTAGTSFTIKSTSSTDTSTIAYYVISY